MKINGINVQKEFENRPNEETWKTVFHDLRHVGTISRTITDKLAQPIIYSYWRAVAYNGPVSKLKVDENDSVILPKGTLIHLTRPCIDEKRTVIDYDKFGSIGKEGLISLGMLDEDAYDMDDEVPLQVSFHRCAKTQTVKEKLNGICERNNIDKIIDIAFIVDVQNKGIKELMNYDIARYNLSIDYGNGYKTNDGAFVGYKLKEYPEGINTDEEKLALGYLLQGSKPITNGQDFAYLPLGVPSKYVVGIVLPKDLENNKELRNYLSKTYKNATLISSEGKVLKPLEEEETM